MNSRIFFKIKRNINKVVFGRRRNFLLEFKAERERERDLRKKEKILFKKKK